MRLRSIVAAAVTVLIVAGGLYYFYSYRDRDLSDDISAMREYTGDVATTSAVKTALALNKQVSSLDIQVSSTNNPDTGNNNVTLTGKVPTDDDKQVAEEIARGTKGVATVVNNLEVSSGTQAASAEGQYVSDLEIEAALLKSFLNNPGLNTQQITVAVSNGEVKLSGSVQTPTQKSDAEAAARVIANVSNVDSNALIVINKGEGQP